MISARYVYYNKIQRDAFILFDSISYLYRMKFNRYSTWLGVLSLLFLFVVLLSPNTYSILKWKNLVLCTGRLFPFLVISWCASFVAIALNFIDAERALVLDNICIPRKRKWMPLYLSAPAVISFVWFISQIFIGPR